MTSPPKKKQSRQAKWNAKNRAQIRNKQREAEAKKKQQRAKNTQQKRESRARIAAAAAALASIPPPTPAAAAPQPPLPPPQTPVAVFIRPPPIAGVSSAASMPHSSPHARGIPSTPQSGFSFNSADMRAVIESNNKRDVEEAAGEREVLRGFREGEAQLDHTLVMQLKDGLLKIQESSQKRDDDRLDKYMMSATKRAAKKDAWDANFLNAFGNDTRPMAPAELFSGPPCHSPALHTPATFSAIGSASFPPSTPGMSVTQPILPSSTAHFRVSDIPGVPVVPHQQDTPGVPFVPHQQDAHHVPPLPDSDDEDTTDEDDASHVSEITV